MPCSYSYSNISARWMLTLSLLTIQTSAQNSFLGYLKIIIAQTGWGPCWLLLTSLVMPLPRAKCACWLYCEKEKCFPIHTASVSHVALLSSGHTSGQHSEWMTRCRESPGSPGIWRMVKETRAQMHLGDLFHHCIPWFEQIDPFMEGGLDSFCAGEKRERASSILRI